ncbi:M10 family metallopeptidase C-terminal domain-containing protein [Ruegeria sp. MALMAid1280]|uniref:M10 family metallopeptidase C-terminal domain-containing protein n=1 Tax=Ruegeria sp. MALMAid1280 TaxID=3411634 RepID=UPI003B9F9C0F
MATTTYIPRPSSSSPVSAIQGTRAYGDGNPATVITITYNFGKLSDTQNWTSEYKAEFRAALAAIEAVANIRFVESNSSSADLVEYIAPASSFSSPNALGFHFGPSNLPSHGAYNTNYWNAGPGGNGDPGGYFFTTLIHELGHALGLGHPHDTGFGTTVMAGVTSPFNSFGAGNLNQSVYTVMSYNDGWTSTNGILPSNSTFGGSTGFGALDIAALQAMYGANTTTNSGNNVYTLPSANVASTGYQAIWDTGGNDTIQHLGTSDAWIDLRPATLDYTATGGGVVSSAAGVRGGFTIAHNVTIEKASGGVGDDTIYGNYAQNVLRGNNGNDTIYSLSNGSNNNTIYGGHGNDTIYLAHGTGSDQVFGDQGNDIAIVTSNDGSFYGGSGTDTIRFTTAISNYLFLRNGTSYEFLNVITRITFTITNDVELIQFLNGVQQLTWSNIATAMQLSDVDTTGTTLQHANHGIYVLDSAGSNVALTLGGEVIGAGSIAGWQAIQAESSGGGYRVLWKSSDAGYGEWTVNSQGQQTSGQIVSNVAEVETFYNADLNGDGTIGHTTTSIETDGSVALSSSTRSGYRINGNIELTRNGANAGPESIPGWEAIHAEAFNGGFKVLWKNANGSYGEWITNAAGEYLNSAAINNVVDAETFYNVDLNGDGTIGHKTTSIETDGSVALASSTRGGYVINGSVELTRNGAKVGPDSFPGWEAVHAEAFNGGFRVLWKDTAGQYGEWITDSSGTYIGSTGVGNVIDVEAFYGVDLNGDGQTGHFSTNIETAGSVTLASSTRGVYLVNGSVELSSNGVKTGPDSIPGWEAVHAEAFNGGFKVLWKNTNGDYGEWITDASGAYISSTMIPDVIDVEDFYGYDINGSGTVGYELPKLAHPSSATQKLVSKNEGLGEPGWAETVDVLKFIPDMAANADDDDGVELIETSVIGFAGISTSTKLVEVSSNNDITYEDSDLTIANLLEEDTFLL